MSRPLAIDLTRLALGLLRTTPRGIDRVEFGCARGLLDTWPGECVAVLPSPWGVRFIPRERAVQFVNLVERVWREGTEPQSHDSHTAVNDWLAQGGPAPRFAKRQTVFSGRRLAQAMWRLARNVGISRGRPVARLPERSVYLNVGQSGLAVSPLMSWLGRREDVRPVFMLHDVIPLEYPEYVPAIEVKHFHRIVANTARYAAGLITSTEAAATSIRQQLLLKGRQEIPAVTIPLPIAESFLAHDDPPEPSGRNYFVCCGSIEPRKNHLLLLNVWRDLVRRHGPSAPKLVILGSRWRPGEPLIAMLERCEALRHHVCEVHGVPTPVLRRLLRGARGALMPSFAEGFGMPIIEALAVGTPVIASDLPAHREAGGNAATYVDPLDGPGWRAAIEALAASRNPATRHAPYTPTRWSDYIAKLKPFLDEI